MPGGIARAHAVAPKAVHIAFFSEAISNTYTHATQLAVQAVAQKEGATLQIFDAAFDAHKQYTQMQDAIASHKFNAFLSVPLDAVGLVSVTEQAARAGIKSGVISYAVGAKLNTYQPQVPGEWVAVLDPASLRGKWAGGLIVQACAHTNPCKVAYLIGDPALPTDRMEQKAMLSVLAQHPNIHIVTTQTGGYLESVALKAMQNILQAHKDLNVVASTGDQMIIGSIIALKAAGMTVGLGSKDVKVIGLGASAPAVKGIRDGTWFGTVLSLPYLEGKLATQLIIKAVRGQLKKPIGESASLSSGRNPMVTRSTIGNLKAQWQG